MKQKISPKLEKKLEKVEAEIAAGKVSKAFRSANAFLADLKS